MERVALDVLKLILQKRGGRRGRGRVRARGGATTRYQQAWVLPPWQQQAWPQEPWPQQPWTQQPWPQHPWPQQAYPQYAWAWPQNVEGVPPFAVPQAAVAPQTAPEAAVAAPSSAPSEQSGA